MFSGKRKLDTECEHPSRDFQSGGSNRHRSPLSIVSNLPNLARGSITEFSCKSPNFSDAQNVSTQHATGFHSASEHGFQFVSRESAAWEGSQQLFLPKEEDAGSLHMAESRPDFEHDDSDEEDAEDEILEEDILLEEPGLQFGSVEESMVSCPVCGISFGSETVERQTVHINRCLDNCTPGQLGTSVEHGWAQSAQQDMGTATVATKCCKDAPQRSILDFIPGGSSKSSSVGRGGGSSKPGRGAKAKSGRYKGRFAARNKKLKKGRVLAEALGEMPTWMSVPGTSFRVDAFKYPSNDCSHWFLTHFHPESYQGLTRSFPHGTIYCSPLTGRLLSLKVGVPPGTMRAIPLGERTRIEGVDVTLIDANHCPGSVMILFELPDGQTILHTGHFRICPEMEANPLLTTLHFNTVILDMTDSHPESHFPKQESVINFVIDAIRAEAFNPKTLFLIGTDPVGKEKIFLEVVRQLKRKVYVGVAKRRLLASLELPEDDMALLTADDRDSHIHAVPLWSITSFRRMEQIARHYRGRYNTVIAFAPRGECFERGKKRTPRRKYHQVSFIRYDLPYSEHSTFLELQEFLKLVEPESIIPSNMKRGQEEIMEALVQSLQTADVAQQVDHV